MVVEAVESSRFVNKAQISGEELASIAAHVQNGECEAFAPLFEIYRPFIQGVLLRSLGDETEAEDLMMESFSKAFSRLQEEGFQDRGISAGPWLLKIARSTMIDYIRRTRRRPTTELPEEFEDDKDTEGTAIRTIELETLRREVATLSESQREVITLRFYADLSPKETASELGKEVNNVRTLQTKAVHRLRQRMGTEFARSNSPREPDNRIILKLLDGGERFTARELAMKIRSSVKHARSCLEHLKAKGFEVLQENGRYYLPKWHP